MLELNAKSSAILCGECLPSRTQHLVPEGVDKVRQRREELHSILQGIPKDMGDLEQTTDISQL